MEQFIKIGNKAHFIYNKPSRSQLYFLYKLIMNRKQFKYYMRDRILSCIDRLSCCKKKCSGRLAKAKKRAETYERGQKKLTDDLDIVRLIFREQMHDVNKRVLYNSTERFFLQYQRRKVIESSDRSEIEKKEFHLKTNWKHLVRKENRKEFKQMVRKNFQEM